MFYTFQVLDAGQLVEFDEPYNLLQNMDGIFTRMVRETGNVEEDRLLKIAEEKHREKQQL